MSLELINAKDRIPVNVLSNGAIRYGRYDANGNLLGYEYMKREDEPIEEGTNINKVLLDLIDNNFLFEQANRMRVDRYNVPEYQRGKVGENTVSMIASISNEVGGTQTSYHVGDLNLNTEFETAGVKILQTANNEYADALIYVIKTGALGSENHHKIDSDSVGNFESEIGEAGVVGYCIYGLNNFIQNISINSIKVGTASTYENCNIRCDYMEPNSNEWITVGTGPTISGVDANNPTVSTFTINKIVKKIRLVYIPTSSGRVFCKNNSLTLYGKYNIYGNLLSLKGSDFNKITEYENNSIVNIKIPEELDLSLPTYLSINNLEAKEITFTNIPKAGEKYILVYDGTNFEAIKVNDKIIKNLLTIDKKITFGISTHTITEIVNTEYDIIKVNMNYQNVYYDDNIVLNGTNILSKNTTGTTTTATSTTNALTIHSGTIGTSYGTLLLMLEIDTKRKIFTYKVLAERESKVYYIGFGKFESLTSLVITQGRSGESYPTAFTPNIKLEVIGEKVVQ